MDIESLVDKLGRIQAAKDIDLPAITRVNDIFWWTRRIEFSTSSLTTLIELLSALQQGHTPKSAIAVEDFRFAQPFSCLTPALGLV